MGSRGRAAVVKKDESHVLATELPYQGDLAKKVRNVLEQCVLGSLETVRGNRKCINSQRRCRISLVLFCFVFQVGVRIAYPFAHG